MRKMLFMGGNVLKEFVKSTQHIPPYSKTAKLLIKSTYTVKSYLMDYVGDVKFIVEFAAVLHRLFNGSGACIKFHFEEASFNMHENFFITQFYVKFLGLESSWAMKKGCKCCERYLVTSFISRLFEWWLKFISACASSWMKAKCGAEGVGG